MFLRFGWSPVSHHRKVIINRLKPVIEKRLEEKKENGDSYESYVSHIVIFYHENE
jgi:hypothetical protein